MEKLKSAIPEALKRDIEGSSKEDLPLTCSHLLHFFQSFPLFLQMVSDLTDPELALCGKNKEAAMEAKAKGNECFFKGDYSSASSFYSQALRVAPMDVEDKGKNLVATLYFNRASSWHEMGLFLECLRDCSRALTIYPPYAKAWYRRSKANSSLGNYDDAINDLNVVLKIEETLSGRKKIESELQVLLKQSRLRRNDSGKSNDDTSDERLQMELKCISTRNKGRGLTSFTDIPVASLIHREDPYAAIILKNCRETHCAFCFNELPADTVPCVACSSLVFCSVKCQVQAGGHDHPKYKRNSGFLQDLPKGLEQYVGNVISQGTLVSDLQSGAEHKHECQGMHWSAVLPSDVVLVGRIVAKHIQSSGSNDVKIHGILDLCENYGKLPPKCKLEFHVYSMILICCLQQFFSAKFPLNSATAAEVQVAQAVYPGGSLFNHSCEPNVHAYFISRSLFIRATENVIAGSELELSYGPQVGQWNCSHRRKSLEEQYLFTCQCSGCARVNLSDLVHSGYRCVRTNCFGVVLDSHIVKYEKDKQLKGSKTMQGYALKDGDIGRVARRIFDQTNFSSCFKPGYCLSCGTFCDLQASQSTIAEAEICIGRLQDAIANGETSTNLIADSLKSLETLRSRLHPFNKRIAEVEDSIAQAFCSTGDMQAAMEHCQASIEILEKLYGENHIVIGNELIKLASIHRCLGRGVNAENTNRLVSIFSRHYGSHADKLFPYLDYLKDGVV
ncbi:uncharacterized protein LOC127256513 isoform X2 [Andrographis paniculata]|uniref:uncharacterized protein LOC127256513 isoform X2 n=1 Tax=Andrographis paniculata TaxID=175694 RepID=UPI0021E8E740|nr:uncharacterized protein LOC127256513 isoform X2 [Andrographis paniculata]